MPVFITLYTICIILFIPFIVIRLLYKSISFPEYNKRILERFGIYKNSNSSSIDIWIHAVSLGETIAIVPLVNFYIQNNKRVLITNMTPTGSDYVRKYLNKKVRNCYLPYDIPFAINNFFKKFKIKKGIIVETELWPNIINKTYKLNIPLFLVNARISDKSFKGYKKIKFLIMPILQRFTKILTQSAEDQKKFITLGSNKKNTVNTGNIKFDISIPITTDNKIFNLKKKWQEQNKIILIAGSTHDPEEKLLLEQFYKFKKKIHNLILIIAPRHPERFIEVLNTAKIYTDKVSLYSDISSEDTENDILIVNELGKLLDFYACANYAFVGGSWSDTGGHNVLEPISLNVPTFTGLNTWNFKEIINKLHNVKGINLVKNATELYNRIVYLNINPVENQNIVNCANKVIQQHKGATKRILNNIENL